jgi:hypothetical protein
LHFSLFAAASGCLQDRSLPVAWWEKLANRFRAERIIQINAGYQAMITQPRALGKVPRQEAE